MVSRAKPLTTEGELLLKTVGIDIGKEVFHIVGFAERQDRFALQAPAAGAPKPFKKLPRCIVGMEACLSAHFVSRTLRLLGIEPRIIPAFYVKPFVKGQKNDYNDAEAIAEAALRPNLQTWYGEDPGSARSAGLPSGALAPGVATTAAINQVRAFLIEQGIAVRSGSNALRKSLFEILKKRQGRDLATDAGLIVGLYQDWLWLDARIEAIKLRGREGQPERGKKLQTADERPRDRAVDLD